MLGISTRNHLNSKMKVESFIHKLSSLNWKCPDWPQSTPLPYNIQWHRGGPHEGVLENTIPAFKKTTEYGVNMIEFDVRYVEGHLLCFHDDHMERLQWWPAHISELSLKDIKANLPVSTLGEILSEPGLPEYLNIEVKCDLGLEKKSLEALVDAICPYLGRRAMLVSSFNPFFLYLLKRELPDLPRALIVSWDYEPRNALWLRGMSLLRFINPHIIHFQNEYMTPELAEFWNDRGIRWAIWTVNTTQRTKELLDLGAQSIITDKIYFRDQDLLSI